LPFGTDPAQIGEAIATTTISACFKISSTGSVIEQVSHVADSRTLSPRQGLRISVAIRDGAIRGRATPTLALMAFASPRPELSSPEAVANATFSTARKGFDPHEVQEFLRQVAGEISRLQERQRILERELDSRLDARPADLDEDTVTRLLGEEATRILQTARESGNQIKARAEESAARLLRESTEEAQRQREEADREAARRRSDAVADAEAELAMAKQQGREMVEEARAYRERVLGELARRRELARQQIEQLVHGRDRLLEAFERARMVAIDVVAEISPLGSPEEYADFEPPGGPVPLASLPAPTEPSPVEVAVAEAEVAEDLEDEITESPVAPEDSGPAIGGGTVVPFPTAGDEAANPTQVNDVEDLFARIRADHDEQPEDGDVTITAEVPVEDAVDEVAAPETPFQRRDAELVPLIVASARKLKRVLADEQNEVLDALRRREPVRSLDGLLSSEPEQSGRYVDAIASELVLAAEAGSASVDGTVPLALGPEGSLAPARESLVSGLVVPLRERLDRCVEEGDGDNDAVTKRARAVYREWKTQRIDEQLDDVFRVAYGRGACDAIEPGTPVTWIVDPAGPACPDAEDNSLAGTVALGEAFPTGHTCAPAHPGCRCLLALVDR
jgi:DivIVA domain-containing protein